MSGRGQYYKNKYGGGGRGRGGGGNRGGFQPNSSSTNRAFESTPTTGGEDWQRLENDLKRINGKQYGAYKDLLGKYQHVGPLFVLSIDHVQGDAYAAPSRVSAIMQWAETGFPNEYLNSDIRKIALCDFVTRIAADMIRAKHLDQNIGGGGGWSGPKGGSFNINSPGQEVLPRTSAMINGSSTIELRFTASLPAAGRTILGQEAFQILGVNLVELVRQSLLHVNVNQKALQQHILSVERQSYLRQQLHSQGLIAFLANGSILPRASGAAAMPMDAAKAVPFKSPKESEVTLGCPDGSKVTGMGIPRGITLLTGGGFHGKSTLLEALELGVYNHIVGDGRELVVTDPTAVKIRAEDGRSVSGVDISPFIKNLPGGKDTKRFSTDDASGSTSMATNIQEALETECTTLLIDEDSSATNLLVRDQLMQLLVKNEPITPLISKVKALYKQRGVSTVIVIGGLGDWLSVSDNVIMMDSYVPHNSTTEAKAMVEQNPRVISQDSSYGTLPERKFRIDLAGFRSPYAQRKSFINIKPQTKNPVDDPAEAEAGIDLSSLDQIVEVGQSRMIATLLEDTARATKDGALSLAALLEGVNKAIDVEKCLPVAISGGDLVVVRRFELVAALARLRGLFVTD